MPAGILGGVVKFLRVIVSELEQPRQQLLGVSQTCKLEQQVDALQMLSTYTFVYRKVLHTG